MEALNQENLDIYYPKKSTEVKATNLQLKLFF
jgi:hypothetical protein